MALVVHESDSIRSVCFEELTADHHLDLTVFDHSIAFGIACSHQFNVMSAADIFQVV
jgi:hypothetical protein